jgi:hypothetical protein
VERRAASRVLQPWRVPVSVLAPAYILLPYLTSAMLTVVALWDHDRGGAIDYTVLGLAPMS